MILQDAWTKLIWCVALISLNAQANALSNDLKHLADAYPDTIQHVSSSYIAWKDGTKMPVRGSFPFLGRIAGLFYQFDYSHGELALNSDARDRYEPILRKMYGDTPSKVKQNLVTVYWMPHVFGNNYPLRVTTVNGVDKRLRRVSAELEKLPPSYHKYLSNPAGAFYWRKVAGERYLSAHSFGIAIDINLKYSNYWLWDYLRTGKPITELPYQNRIPMKIVQIFEKEGFYWGGRWRFYDTMHFEYRPDLLM